MVSDAEKFNAKDEAAAARISAKDGPGSYANNLQNSLIKEESASKLDAGDKSKLQGTSHLLLDAAQEASEAEYKVQQKGLESVAASIMPKAYAAAGQTPRTAPGELTRAGAGPVSGAGHSKHQVKEVDQMFLALEMF